MAERARAAGDGRRPRSTAPGGRSRSERGGRSAGRGAKQPPAGRKRTSGRYTAPIPRQVKRSPKWYPWMLLTVLLAGILVIILNYINALPSSPTNWYTVGGLVAILSAALLATRYH